MQTHEIKAQKLYNLIQAHRAEENSLEILDVRSRDEFVRSHVFNAKNAPNLKTAKETARNIRTPNSLCIIGDDQETTKFLMVANARCNIAAPNVQEWFYDIQRKPCLALASYASFRESYPFLCVSEAVQESSTNAAHAAAAIIYPFEILQSQLFAGNIFHALNIRILERLRVRAVLDLTPHGIRHQTTSAPSELDIILSQLDYHHRDPGPVLNAEGLAESAGILKESLHALRSSMDESGKRKTMMVVGPPAMVGAAIASYLMQEKHWSYQQSLSFVVSKAPVVRLTTPQHHSLYALEGLLSISDVTAGT